METEIVSPEESARARQVIIETLGVKDVAAFDITGMIFALGNLMERLGDCALRGGQLSSARLLLLTKLVVAERLGHTRGVTPTVLSRHSNVSRNTISALLRGLEEQGLITRALDLDDRRKIRTRLTDAGRKLVLDQAPRFHEYTESLFGHLTQEERETLLRLLEKVRDALVEKCVEFEGQ